MVEWNNVYIYIIIAGGVAIIGSLLPWWVMSPELGGFPVQMGVNPIFGFLILMQFIKTGPLVIVSGVIALVGGGLIFLAFMNKIYALIGGCLAIAGAAMFIPFFLIEGLWLYNGMGYAQVFLPLFGSIDLTALGYGIFTTYLTYGFYMTIVGGVLAFVAAFKMRAVA